MSNRPRHDYKAHFRAIQMSTRIMFAYCEGRSCDPYVYSELVRRAQPAGEKTYELYRIEEITGTGGKAALIQTFGVMRKKRLLTSNFKGKSFACVFFLDKDVDDLKRRRLRSDHIFYTALYDLEAHILRDCDLVRALAIGLNTDIEEISPSYRNAASWVEAKATQWEHWLRLCVFSALFDLDCGCGYGRPSQVHSASTGETDITAYTRFKARLATKSGLSESEFNREFARIEKTIARMKKRNSLSLIFKGKWLNSILSNEVHRQFSGKPINFDGLSTRTFGAAMACFSFDTGWARAHVGRLSRIISDLSPVR